MSVATQLGLEGPDADLLRPAQQQWEEWASSYPVLVDAPPLPGLHGWMRSLEVEPRNEVVCALGRLGSRDGRDEVAAAAALAWLLVPGAITVARGLRGASPVIDELVASQLWLEVRTLPVTSTHKVAANILANVRAAVRRDVGISPVRDTTWARCTLRDPHEPAWLEIAAPPHDPTARAALRLLLQQAVTDRVISAGDCRLLVHLTAWSGEGDRTRGRAGLVTRRATCAVGAELRLSDRQVRRRAARAVDALAATYADRVPA
ncbi:MAG: hypothetical protein IE926_08635 [Micrococcales bacterium]|nr:hypothetical protein [Micrococcales bacterium]